MESFWATLKRELAWIHHRHRWDNRAELRRAPFDYIEAFYNRDRHQTGLGHRTPAEVYAAAKVARSTETPCPPKRVNSRSTPRGDNCLDAAMAHTELLGGFTQRNRILQHAANTPMHE
jgi:hypothetical protein